MGDRKHHLKKAFNITEAKYDRLLRQQHGRCAICERLPSPHRRLAVDHDHKTDIIRGLLCTRCNVGLGLFQESAEIVRSALSYLMF